MSLLRLTTRQLPTTLRSSTRSFSVAARRMAEGESRGGGASQGDAFQKREQANENYTIQQREKEKLMALRKKVADGEAQLKKDKDELEQAHKSK
ncbi:hypothetical protein LTR62_008236 [Meristemomyces frigidus]|uniref:ATPase inhibitor, mitochondrial n=1 Tax=Meristemomyces frigidus TaxID=1508187 RepID=A0AAN7YCR6_9PEZI|nr:hypothetical protein LTR62_008236 [Meristemomyces frigidus]